MRFGAAAFKRNSLAWQGEVVKALAEYIQERMAGACYMSLFYFEKMGAAMNSLRRFTSPLAGVFIMLILFQLSQLPALSHNESVELASHFAFKKSPLLEASTYPHKSRRGVNPGLERISAWISSVGAAVALADLDGDGLSNDFCSVDPRTDLVTVGPLPGTPPRYLPFTLDPAPLHYDASTMAPMGALPGDLNEDGLTDVLVYYWGRTPIAFLRQKADQQGAAPRLSGSDYVPIDIIPTGERWYTCTATQADLDGDGHLDIIIGNYFQDGARILDLKATSADQMHDTKARSFNGGWKHLLLWAGDASGTQPDVQFKDVKGVLNEQVARGWTLAVGAVDLDGDLLPEIYFANDFGPDRLLHNLSTPGNLRFDLLEGRKEFATPASFVMGADSFKGMGVDFGDLNGDGIPDIYVSNISSPFGLQESHFLWLSTGDLSLINKHVSPYKQSSEALGLSRSGWGWDCRLDDFDNDGGLEALQATGFLKGSVNRWPELQSLGTANSEMMHDARYWPRFQPGDDVSGSETNAFFARAKDGRFYDIAGQVGLGDATVSRGIAIADVDGDGLLDFAVANQWETSFFYHNDSPRPGAFLGLHLLLPLGESAMRVRPGHPGIDTPGRPAIGAAAVVELPGGRRLTGQVDGGSGHSGKRSPDLHFGLGAVGNTEPIKVNLRWRSAGGQVRNRSLSLTPGWHTVLLD
jgi:hypothetical protein